MKNRIKATLVSVLMLLAALLTIVLRPALPSTDDLAKIDLQHSVPESFGSWNKINLEPASIVNPQQQESLENIYVDILERAYRDSQTGLVVMLSLAYGGVQTKQSQIHRPEVCYPAQGFQIEQSRDDHIATSYGNIPIRHLVVKQGGRVEPISYWIRVGNRVARGWFEQKMIAVQQSLLGNVPTGILFRISSIEPNSALAYEVQSRFVRELLTVLPESTRVFLIGVQDE